MTVGLRMGMGRCKRSNPECLSIMVLHLGSTTRILNYKKRRLRTTKERRKSTTIARTVTEFQKWQGDKSLSLTHSVISLHLSFHVFPREIVL